MLSLPTIPATSPTLAEAMRSCLLRAGLSRVPGINSYVLGNAKAWLGTAYHKVLERIPELAAAGDQAPALLEQLWQEEIARLQQEASNHPLNQRFGQPLYWRGYHLVLATLKLRAAEMMPSTGAHPPQPASGGMPETFREKDFLAFSGKLKGKPDLGRGEEIIDFKTGSIYEAEDLDASPALKEAYVRQLRIYAYLLHEAVGRWPRRGLLYPIAGSPVEVDLDPAACVQEATEAVALLDRYNGALGRAADPADLASASPDTCRWCPYKVLCPAFWKSADPSWAGTLDGEAASGRLLGPVRSVFGGTAYALSIDADGGTVPPGGISLSPLPVAVHPGVSGLSESDHVRVVGLGRRENGTLYPTPRTVILSDAAAPGIACRPAGNEGTE